MQLKPRLKSTEIDVVYAASEPSDAHNIGR